MFVKLVFLVIFLVFPIARATTNNACKNINAYYILPFSNQCFYNPNVLYDVVTIVTRDGYNLEVHTVTTPDGYILPIYRIIPSGSPKGVVFLQHGLAKNPVHWVYRNNRSLAFNFVNRGYEVWLGNFRGSTFAQTHVYLSINDPRYWNFTVDQLAEYDLGTQLEYVANKTGAGGEIIYIGHSMGTTTGLMLASKFPEKTSSLVQRIVALCPSIYFKDTVLLKNISPLISFLKAIGIKGIFYQEVAIHKTFTTLCYGFPRICRWILFWFFGESVQFPPETLPLFFSNWPTGFSVKVTDHFNQLYKSNNFQQYDYGKAGNLLQYGSATPPLYDLGKVNVPVHLFYGRRDTLYNQNDLDRVFSEIGSEGKTQQKVPKDNDELDFNHIDFLVSDNVTELFYPDLFQTIGVPN